MGVFTFRMNVLLSLLALSPLAVIAREKPVDEARHARYASGEVMDAIMAEKEATWQHYASLGYFTPGRWKSANKFAACVDGHVNIRLDENITQYSCSNLDLTGHLSHDELGSEDPTLRIGSSAWGITLEGREFGIVAQTDGAAFVEIVGRGWWNWIPFFGKAEGSLDYLGRLPTQSIPSLWREIRSYKHYAIIGSEAVGHGVQIFDLRKLLDVRPSWNRLSTATKTFSNITDVSVFRDLPTGRSHNVVAAEHSNHILAVGFQPRNNSCGAGLLFIDVSDPKNPKTSGCAGQDGYVHDAQCLLYRGPDNKYYGREVCYGYNEDSLTIYDITNKANATIISRTSYEGVEYTHQGWVLDTENQEYLILDDEYDEQRLTNPGADGHATTYIWDIKSLEAPKQTGYYKASIPSIDHNQYVKNGFSYQSNYGAGLRILDVSSIPRDPTGKGVKEVAFFDIFPDDDAAPTPVFMGTWGHYPYYKSGHILINSFDRGAFVVKRSNKVTGKVRAQF